MSSARGKTAYRRSAKRRVRQGKRWIFPVVLLLCVLIAAFGASAAYFVYSPAGYNDEDVTKYVRSIYGKNWKLQKREENPDGYSTTTGFLYKDEETDSTFSVFSLSVPVEKDSVQTGRSHKALYDNYFSKVIDSHMEELTELAQKTYKNGGPELVIEEAGLPDAAFRCPVCLPCLSGERSTIGGDSKAHRRYGQAAGFFLRDGRGTLDIPAGCHSLCTCLYEACQGGYRRCGRRDPCR